MNDREKDRYIKVLETLLDEREKVLSLIPECSQHGDKCMPHCSDWIKAHILSEYDIKCPQCGKVKNICKYENRVCDECEDKPTQSDEEVLMKIIDDDTIISDIVTYPEKKIIAQEILKHFTRK